MPWSEAAAGLRGVRSPRGTGSDKATCGVVGALGWGDRLGPILALLPIHQVVLGKSRPSVGLLPGQQASEVLEPLDSREVPNSPPLLALCFKGCRVPTAGPTRPGGPSPGSTPQAACST